MNGLRWNDLVKPIPHLPGISIEPAPIEPGAALPPMDIAAFAGFALRGPCHRAVAIDSVAAFEAVFGGDVILAADPHGGRDLTGHLASTVRGFFANGGRKCWVSRIARTSASEASWLAASGRASLDTAVAASASFAMPGVLQRLPGSAASSHSRLRPAWLSAASPGSWSDALSVQARTLLTPLAVKTCSKLADLPDLDSLGAGSATALQLQGFRATHNGVRFADPGGVPVGALIEFAAADDRVRRYARVIRLRGGDCHALWCAAFARCDSGDDIVIAGHAQVPGHGHHYGAQFERKDNKAELAFAETPAATDPGAWLRFFAPNQAIWMMLEGWRGPIAHGACWREISHDAPRGSFSARRVQLDLAANLAGDRTISSRIEPVLTGPGSLLALVDDDRWYALPGHRRAAARPHLALRNKDRARLSAAADSNAFAAAASRFGTLAFTAADRELLRACWLPLGAAPAFAARSQAVHDGRRALQRDGLALLDDALFLDPAFAALPADRVAVALAQQRDLTERQLFGMHALLDTPDSGFGYPTIIAVPDLTQPGWDLAMGSGVPGRPAADTGTPPSWRDHLGGCRGSEAPDDLAAPDFSRFLDSTTRLLDTPRLSGPVTPVRDGNFMLRWRDGPAGVPVVLEQSGAADFAVSAEIYRGTASSFALSTLGQGIWYFRLRADDGANLSAWSVFAVQVRRADYVATAGDPAALVRWQLALLRAAAGSHSLFALLSFPAALNQAEARVQAARLTALAPDFARADQLGPQEQRVLSYGALYHGWLLYRAAPDGRNLLSASPPEGCVAGQMARLARGDGAWISPANRAIADVVGVTPRFDPRARLVLQEARINAMVATGRGFAAGDAMTLSDEPEWRQLNVRRLMTMLRLVALRRGEPLVFEPNGDVVRRALEREFSQMLGDFQRRGAFAGGRQGWRLAIATTAADRDAGRLVAEIGVAPSQPLRFLTFRLVQQGARLTLAEAA